MAPPRLFACPSCSIHVKRGEGQCPHCGAAIGPESGAVRTATAVLMGLTLSACPISEPQPEYGVPATESATEATTEATTAATTTAATAMGTTEATAGTDTATGTTGTASGTATDSGTSMTTSMTTAEPDYGVPDTSGLRARDPEE